MDIVPANILDTRTFLRRNICIGPKIPRLISDLQRCLALFLHGDRARLAVPPFLVFMPS